MESVSTELVAANGTDAWEVRITAEPAACNNKDGPRDGRNYGATQALWQKTRVDAPGWPRTGDRISAYVIERISYDPDRLPPGWKEQVAPPVEEVRTEAIIWQPLLPGAAAHLSLTIEFPVKHVKLVAIDASASVETPAGKFTTCIEVEEVVTPQKGLDQTVPWETGWKTLRYFCRGVGLVKELQVNQAGETLYAMRLTHYLHVIVNEAKLPDCDCLTYTANYSLTASMMKYEQVESDGKVCVLDTQRSRKSPRFKGRIATDGCEDACCRFERTVRFSQECFSVGALVDAYGMTKPEFRFCLDGSVVLTGQIGR